MDELKEKARNLIFQSSLRDFPVIFELYVRTFKPDLNLDEGMTDIIAIIRTAPNSDAAYRVVCSYLDAAENRAKVE